MGWCVINSANALIIAILSLVLFPHLRQHDANYVPGSIPYNVQIMNIVLWIKPL